MKSDTDDLPTLEKARALAARGALADPAAIDASVAAAQAIAREPVETRKLAGIVLHADVLRRESWEEEVELPPALFERYPTSTPDVPEHFRAEGYQLIDASRGAKHAKCKNCFLSPGTILCTRCFGQPTPDEGTCVYCNGAPVTCTMCDGSGETVRATLRHVNDRPVAVRRAFVPALPEAVAALVAAVVDASVTPPAAQQFALQANVVESAYRGASALRAPEYRGHQFGEALDAALAAERELDRYTDVVKREVRAYAWPILLLRFSEPDDRWIAVLDDADGTLRILGVDSREARRRT